jgi:hypothetical protein
VVYENPIKIPAGADSLQFPIWKTPPNSDARRNIACLSDPVRAAIDFVQPHNRTSNILPIHPLILLGNLDNGNKHRLLYLTTAALANANATITYSGQMQDDPTVELHKGEVKDGTEVIKLTFQTSHPQMKYDYGINLIIAIMHESKTATGADRDDYCALIEILIDEVLFVIGSVTAVVK